jgi:hypothetical protein
MHAGPFAFFGDFSLPVLPHKRGIKDLISISKQQWAIITIKAAPN